MAPADWERRHAGQVESWTFDFWAPAAGVPALAGFVGFAFLPGRAWCWAALVGTGRPYLLVRDLDLDPPRRPGSRQLRGSLWADANCETPHEHWSVGLEAYGVELDEPDDALRGERGVRTGLGIDLEWEADGPPIGAAGDYAAAARVHGEVLVGAGRDVETIAVDGAGLWRHRWGEGDPLATRTSLQARRCDGSLVAVEPPSGDLVVHHRAPLLLEVGNRRAVLERTLVTFEDAGLVAVGWSDEVAPPPARAR